MAAVARKAANGPVGVLPPASPFAELLRKSRFASYDPEVKQTYSSPPAYAHRGNWGLKRPISQRRRNAYITLKSYEDHAQYIEWNNAENQVRFIRRFEELNITPDLVSSTPWTKNLGAAQTNLWLTDSEFDHAKETEYKYEVEEEEQAASPEGEVSLDQLGKRGKGQYGAKAPRTIKTPLVPQKTEPWNYRQPNIEAMSSQEFERYLEKIRTLRPEFLKKIRAQLEYKEQAGKLKGTLLNSEMSDLQLALVNSITNDHRAFLNDHFEHHYAERDTEPSAADPTTGEALPRDFARPQIKPQPHRFGGLTYAHPTMLDTLLTTSPHPAFILQGKNESGRYSSHFKEDTIHVSYGGVVAELEKPPPVTKPLFTATSGPSGGEGTHKSVVNVRVKSFRLEETPLVVGRDAQGMNGVRVRETVVESVPNAQRATDNPKTPGSFEYVGMEPPSARPLNLSLSGRRGKAFSFESLAGGRTRNTTAFFSRVPNQRVATGSVAAALKDMAMAQNNQDPKPEEE